MNTYIQHAPCVYFSSTDDGTVLDVNEFLCANLHYSVAELTGRKTDIFSTVSTKIFHQTHLYPLLKMQGHAEEIYITLQKRNGEHLPVLINAERKEIDGTFVNLYTGIIVHNRKKFEEELIAAKKSAEAALNENTALIQAKQELQKHSEALDRQIHLVTKQNDELKQFNRVVSHDMQEPLRKLLLFSNMLLEEDEKTRSKNLVGKIKKVVEQMREILFGLQQYVWLHEISSNKVLIDTGKLIDEAAQQIKDEFPGVQLMIEKNGLQNFTGDKEQWHLLFYQLLSNAIRFRKDGNKTYVTITANTLRLNQFRQLEGKYKYIDFLRIEIKDNGIGLDPLYQHQVFELFKRLHKESGRGIGLSLCKTIIENHNGTIKINGKPGEGATVTIDVPVNITDNN
jgi:sigma-B regulation protein RsbU (phosphoserine phosphatase)